MRRPAARPFNIHVSLVEPGFIRTGLSRNSRVPRESIAEYAPWRTRALDSIARFIDAAPDPDIVGRCVSRIVESRRPKTCYKAGGEAVRVILLRRFLPGSFFEKGFWAHFQKESGP